MQLVKVIIKNFLSIKEERTLKINNGITSIIGLNESGKTTILKAIEKLNGEKILEKEKNITMKNEESYIYGFFKITDDELKNINENISEIYKIPTKETYYIRVLVDDEGNVGYDLFYLNEKNEYEQFNFSYLEKLKSKIRKIKVSKEDIEKLDNIEDSDEEIKKYILSLSKKEEYAEIKDELIKLSNEIDSTNWIDYIPEFEIIKFSSFEDVLKEKATLAEIEKNKRIQNIFKIANINIEDISKAIENNDEFSLQDFESLYVDVVTEKFKKIFVKVDDNFKLRIRIGSANKDISFSTQDKTTKTGSIPIESRSDGFRWYLSMYLTLYDYIEKEEKNKILLLDEPNLYLHAEAQKDLLNRVFKDEFKDLQIIYTTHSPYMIDVDNTFSIRIIEKDTQTNIYNSTREYALQKGGIKDVDAITPLMTALHLNIENNLMINSNDIIILVEGIQDVYILKAMIKKLGLEEEFFNFKFIPCFGSEKVPFMYGYLYGMGYNTYILVDKDKAGIKAMEEISKEKNSPLKEYLFNYAHNKTDKEDILLEDLFNKGDRDKYIPNKSTVLYKDFFDNIEKNNISDETKDNFEKLFKYIQGRIK